MENKAKAEREIRKLSAKVEKLRAKLEETTEPKKMITLKGKLNDLLAEMETCISTKRNMKRQ